MNKPVYRKSPWRFLFLAGAVLSGGNLALRGLLPLLVKHLGAAVSSGENASLGIIGGADGPTAIFVTGVQTQGFDWGLLLTALLLPVCLAAYFRLRRCREK